MASNKQEILNRADDLNIIDDVISNLYDDYEQEQDSAQEVIQAWIRIKEKLKEQD